MRLTKSAPQPAAIDSADNCRCGCYWPGVGGPGPKVTAFAHVTIHRIINSAIYELRPGLIHDEKVVEVSLLYVAAHVWLVREKSTGSTEGQDT